MAEFAFATWDDVQRGFEKPIPIAVQPLVTEFLVRASTRLRLPRPTLKARFEAATDPDDAFRMFVRDMTIDASEVKLRNPGGFSHENAGVFSISRYEDYAKGRIRFDPEDLALLDDLLDAERNAVATGPVRMPIPEYRLP